MMVKACKGGLFLLEVFPVADRVAALGVDAAPYLEVCHGGGRPSERFMGGGGRRLLCSHL